MANAAGVRAAAGPKPVARRGGQLEARRDVRSGQPDRGQAGRRVGRGPYPAGPLQAGVPARASVGSGVTVSGQAGHGSSAGKRAGRRPRDRHAGTRIVRADRDPNAGTANSVASHAPRGATTSLPDSAAVRHGGTTIDGGARDLQPTAGRGVQHGRPTTAGATRTVARGMATGARSATRGQRDGPSRRGPSGRSAAHDGIRTSGHDATMAASARDRRTSEGG